MTDIFELFQRIGGTGKASAAPVTHLIVGLGNPGKEYVGTRHNVGFDAVTALAEALGVRIDRSKHSALIAEALIGDTRVLLMLPQTYMNLSGEAVADAARFYKIPPERILVFCDDISFAPGIIRIRRKGSHGGHNGLRSIVERLGSSDFPRVKIGVGQKPLGWDLADWVLGRLPDTDRDAVRARHADMTEAARLIVSGRIDDAMMRYSK
ncbi:MAG: aminoacyl-tRNA hydrolase [Clostridia bacterium]|nr:aminoacyl-tRNA hydrolase [Clostridia bacterium]